MTTNLPKGFVTNSKSITGDIERIDIVDVEDIFQLWKVYTTNKNVLQNDVGLRLENLFWRIWGNDRIRGNIKGSTVARLFTHISGAQTSKQNTPPPRGPSEIRTNCENRGPLTPPLSLLSTSRRNPPPRLDQQYGQPSSQVSLEVLPVPPAQQLPPPSRERLKAAIPHPILKRYRGSTAGGSTQVIPPAVQEESGSSSTSLTVDIAPRPPTPPKPRKGPTSIKRKRAPFVATTAANNRRKLALVIRKQSQSSTPSNTSPLSPSGQSERVGGTEGVMTPQTANVPEPRTRGSLLSPWESRVSTDPKGGRMRPGPEVEPVDTSSYARHEQKTKECAGGRSNAGSGRTTPGANVGGEDSKADWLVERDFRSKFVDKKRQERFSFLVGHSSASKTGPTLAQSSAEATATIGSGSTTTTKTLTKGKRVIMVDGVAPLKTEGLYPHRMLGVNDESPAPLPRTKSQLTFLLERDRAVKAQEKKNG
ncbi:MAG: hypothetical protein M1840_000262 [Geoglossum simile]|nr:MAG: hypothetical protein M1840_000262 [Geoglossum simile]